MRPSSSAWFAGIALALAAAVPAIPQAAGDPVAKPRPIGEATTALPGPLPAGNGFDLPNGWRVTPAAKPVADLNDLILKMLPSKDGKVIVALHSGYQPHGLSVIDATTHKVVQEVPLKSSWLGLSWSADGKTLYVSGGNANGEKKEAASLAPIYALSYANGRLTPEPAARFTDKLPTEQTWWSGVRADPRRGLVWAANRGTGMDATDVVAFDPKTGAIRKRVRVGVSPYELALSPDQPGLGAGELALGLEHVGGDAAAHHHLAFFHAGLFFDVGHRLPGVLLGQPRPFQVDVGGERLQRQVLGDLGQRRLGLLDADVGLVDGGAGGAEVPQGLTQAEGHLAGRLAGGGGAVGISHVLMPGRGGQGEVGIPARARL